MHLMEILYEDNHLLVINKPSGWIVQGAQPGQSSLLTWAATYLRTKYHKPGNVFVGVVSRLDGPVSGVVPLARTSKAAARLSDQIRERRVKKIYWAVTERPVPRPQDRLQHWLWRPEGADRSIARPSPDSQSQEAILHYRRLASAGNGDLVQIELETGRKHQIRAQFQAIGAPLVGDTRYGASSWPVTSERAKGAMGAMPPIALHCRQFTAKHPTRDEVCTWSALPPASWSQLGLTKQCLEQFTIDEGNA